MIEKEVRLSRIQILDEREPQAAQYGQTVVNLALCLVENLQVVGQLNDYPVRLNPDADASKVFADVNSILGNEGFPPVPPAVLDKTQAIRLTDATILTKARWNVTSAVEVRRRLLAREPSGDLLILADQQLAAARTAVALLEAPSPAGIYKETRFNLVDIRPSGVILVRLRKCYCSGGEVIRPPQYHRFVLTPGKNHAATFAVVNANLAQGLGFPTMTTLDMERILRLAA